MKELLIQALTRKPAGQTLLSNCSEGTISEQTSNVSPLLDRRNFVKLTAAGVGVLASGPAVLATFPRRQTFVPIQQGPPLQQLPPPPLATLTFEVASGVDPQVMLRILQDYIAQTLSPDWAGQVVQAQAIQRAPASFHQNYWSDFSFRGQIPPTRTRYGYYTGVNDVLRSDSQESIRVYQDLNYFEMRRVVNVSEVNTFGMVLQPASYRLPPTPANLEACARVSQNFYGIPNPEAYNLMYTRQFTNGRNAFTGYLIARGNDPMRSPYKDLLIDNVPL